jgi:hypothetical protein
MPNFPIVVKIVGLDGTRIGSIAGIMFEKIFGDSELHEIQLFEIFE